MVNHHYSEVVLQRPKDIREFAAGKVFKSNNFSAYLMVFFTEYFTDDGLPEKVKSYGRQKENH